MSLNFSISFFATDRNIDIATSHLQGYYIRQRFSVAEDDWPPYQPKHYVNLALCHYKKREAKAISLTQKISTVSSDSIEVLHDSESCWNTTNISDIFQLQKSDTKASPYTILIEGAPGIGKTVLSKEIAYLWATKNLLSSKKMLFLIYLRSLTKINSLENLVDFVFRRDELAHNVTEYLAATNGKNLVLVLDGYDELSEKDRKGSFFTDIINRKLLSHCMLVITSRPTATIHLRNVADIEVEILGFTEKDRLQYIEHSLGDSPEKVASMQEFLMSNWQINRLCYIPLNMAILVSQCRKKLPRSQTNMCEIFISVTISRFMRKKAKDAWSASVIGVTEIPEPYKKLFNELTKLAFDALLSDKLVFTLNEIKQVCPSLSTRPIHWNGLGLLQTHAYFDPTSVNECVSFNFLHLSVQEFMAAYHIASLPDKQQVLLLEKTFWTARYFNTWSMYVGITGGKSFGFKHFLSGNWLTMSSRLFGTEHISSIILSNKIKCLYLFECFTETSSIGMVSQIGKLFNNQVIDISGQALTLQDRAVLAYVLSRGPHKRWKFLNLSNCSIDNEVLNSLFGIRDDRVTVHFDVLDLSFNCLDSLSLAKIIEIIKLWKISKVFINNTIPFGNEGLLLRTLESHFFCSGKDSLSLFLMGSFLCLYRSQLNNFTDTLSNTNIVVEHLSVISCSWQLNKSDSDFVLQLIKQQKIHTFHFIDTTFSKHFLSKILSSKKINTCFVHTKYDVFSVLPSIDYNFGVRLAIGKNSVEGMIKTLTLKDDLSDLEILNLLAILRKLLSQPVSLDDTSFSCLWETNLSFVGDKSKVIFDSLVDVLHKTNIRCQVSIALVETTALIAYRVKHHEIATALSSKGILKSVYVSNCNLINTEYKSIIDFVFKQKICSICIIAGRLEEDTIEFLATKLMDSKSTVKELFIHTANLVNISSILQILPLSLDVSAVLVTNDTLAGYRPTIKQIALALQLEPSVSTLRLSKCGMFGEAFFQIVTLLTSTSKHWVLLDFARCSFGDSECSLFHSFVVQKKCGITVRAIDLSLDKLTSSSLSQLAEVCVYAQFEKVVISNTDDAICRCFIFKLESIMISHRFQNAVCLQVLYKGTSACFFSKTKLDKPSLILPKSISSLYVINCQVLLDFDAVSICLLNKLSKVVIISESMDASVILHTANELINLRPKLEIVMYIHDCDDETDILRLKSIRVTNPSNVVGIIVKDYFYLVNITVSVMHMLQKLSGQNFSTSLSSIQEVCKLTQFGSRSVLLHNYCTKVECVNQSNLKAPQFPFNVVKLDFYNCIFSSAEVNDLSELFSFDIEVQEIGFSNIPAQENVLCALYNLTNLSYIDFSFNSVHFEAANDIAKVLASNSLLQHLNLHGNYFGDIGIITIAKALVNNSSLRLFDIGSNGITDESADYIANVISNNTDLLSLNVSRNVLRNAGISKIVIALSACPSLTHFDLSYNSFVGDSVNSIVTLMSNINKNIQCLHLNKINLQSTGVTKILDSLKHVRTLNKLYLGFNDATEETSSVIAAVLCSNSSLMEVDLSGNKFQTSGFVKIADALRQLSMLVKVFISDNCITEKEAHHVATLISCNTKLEELDLSKNYLKSSGAITIAESLQKISTLKSLDLSHNKIRIRAADSIAAALSCNLKLQKFYFQGNYLLTDGVIKTLQAFRNHCTLLQLDFNGIEMTNEVAIAVASVTSANPMLECLNLYSVGVQASGAVKLCKCLSNLTHLVSLSLIHCHITDKAANDLAKALWNNSKLKELNLSMNKLSSVGAKMISKAFYRLRMIEIIDLSNNCISNEAVHSIASGISSFVYLKELNLSGNVMHKEINVILQALQSSLGVKRLSLKGNNIIKEAVYNLAAVLSRNPTLEQLDLSFTNLQVVGGIKIMQSLRNISTMRKLYISDNNITSMAADDLSCILANNINLQELNVSGNDLKSVGAIKICKGLTCINTLLKLDLSNNNITEEAADDIAATLFCNAKLKILHLGSNNLQDLGCMIISKGIAGISALTTLNMCDNNITSKAAKKLGKAILFNPNLQDLDLSQNKLGASGALFICQYLRLITTIKSINLSYNNITGQVADDIASVLATSTNLEKLFISGNALETTGIIKLAIVLASMSGLQRLVCSNNHITSEAADSLAKIIASNRMLQVVDVSKNRLSTEGIAKIARGLSFNCTLTKLDISDCEINDNASHDLACVLSVNNKLQELCLSGNNLGSRGVSVIAKGLQNTYTLIKIDISDNNITEEAGDNIAVILCQNILLQELNFAKNSLSAGVIRISKALLDSKELEKFDISSNYIGAEAADHLASALFCKARLKELNISHNNMKSKGVIDIVNSLVHSESLIKLDISSNNITEEAADAIANLLDNISTIQELRLGSSALNTGGAIKIFDALVQNSMLLSLDISANKISLLSTDSMLNLLNHTKQLRALYLQSNDLGSPGVVKVATALKFYSTLEILNLADNNIDDDAAHEIGEFICSNIKLKQLYLSGNNFSCQGAIKIIGFLQSVSILSFTINNLTDDGASSIEQALSHNDSLEKLYITGKELSASAVGIIAKGILNISTLTIFDVTSNVITAQEATTIATMLSQNRKLQVFIKWK